MRKTITVYCQHNGCNAPIETTSKRRKYCDECRLERGRQQALLQQRKRRSERQPPNETKFKINQRLEFWKMTRENATPRSELKLVKHKYTSEVQPRKRTNISDYAKAAKEKQWR